MISCDTAKNLLSDYLDRNLGQEQFTQIEEHLGRCPECRQVFNDVRFLTAKLRVAVRFSTSDQFDQNLRSRIRSQQQESKPIISKRGFSYGFSGAVVLAGVTFLVINNFSSAPPAGQNILPTAVSARQAAPIRVQKPLAAQAKTQQQIIPKDSLKDKPFSADPNKIKLTGQER